MPNAFLRSVIAQRDAQQREEERLRQGEKAAERRALLDDRMELIRAAGQRNNEVIQHRRANGIPAPARRAGKGVRGSGRGAGHGELHDVQPGELPRFQLGADE